VHFAVVVGCIDYKFVNVLGVHHQTGFGFDVVYKNPNEMTEKCPHGGIDSSGDSIPADELILRPAVFGGTYAD
jgi:hypothetical protein